LRGLPRSSKGQFTTTSSLGIKALDDRARVDVRKARVIELRFFGGLSVEKTAEILQISPQSVMRGWELARSCAALAGILRNRHSKGRNTAHANPIQRSKEI
jgi:hypothetical protein